MKITAILIAFTLISLNAFANQKTDIKNYSSFKSQKITKRKKVASTQKLLSKTSPSIKSNIKPSLEPHQPINLELSFADLNELSLLFPDPVSKTVTKVKLPVPHSK